MIDLANFVIEVLFWMLVFWLMLQIVGGMFHRHLDAKLEEINSEIQEIQKIYKRVKIEEHYDTFYLFDADTDEFLGQGRTAQDAGGQKASPRQRGRRRALVCHHRSCPPGPVPQHCAPGDGGIRCWLCEDSLKARSAAARTARWNHGICARHYRGRR